MNRSPTQLVNSHSNSNKPVTVVGYHGMENFGDDLFLEITRDLLDRLIGPQELLVYASASAPIVDGATKGILPAGWRIKRLDWLRQLRAAFASRAVLFSAGSIFAGPHDGQLRRFARTLKHADHLRSTSTPLLGLGVSIGPFQTENDRAITLDALKRFDALLLRDDESAFEANKMGLRNVIPSYDLATLLHARLPLAAESTASAPLIGLSLGPGFHRNKEALMTFTASFLAAFNAICIRLGRRPSVLVMSTCNSEVDGDVQVADALNGELVRAGIRSKRLNYTAQNRDEFMRSLLSCSGVISSRLHPALIALGAGLPVLQVSATSPKILGVFERIRVRPVVTTRKPSPLRSEWSKFVEHVASPEVCAQLGRSNRAAFIAAGLQCQDQLESVIRAHLAEGRSTLVNIA